MHGSSLGGGRSSRTRARTQLIFVLAAVAVLCGTSESAWARRSAAAPASIRVGTQMLTRCGSAPLSYCGRLAVALDHASPAGPDISIAYRWYPAMGNGAPRGTVVPVEGGPGYASTGSVQYQLDGSQAGYAPMYGPLLAHWNMLVLDNRGTGASTPLRCRALQNFTGATATAAFQRTVGACGEALNRRWRYPDGELVHASDLFTSAAAAGDLAEVIHALDLAKIDLYGDSYGSFFAQAFASRFPGLTRSVILDSTYQALNLDPFYRTTIESMPADFQAVCERAPACAAAAGGAPWSRVATLVTLLRTSTISDVVPGPTGKREQVTMGASGLVDLLSDAAEDPQIYRGLDAAARALLDEGEPAPLLRLYAQREAVDEAYFGRPASEYSVELYFAVACGDYPQLFNPSARPSLRAAELAVAEAHLPTSTFSPFTTAEWLAQNENTEAFTGCLDWPAPTIAQLPTAGAAPLLASSLPVLVLGGELDTWTPPVDVPKVLGQVGGHARFVELANTTHVVGEGNAPCASTLVREFVARPEDLDAIDASCAAGVPAIHAVGAYPAALSSQPPIAPSPGSGASQADLRLAAAVVSTAGDAIARIQSIEAASDRGLYGGTVAARGAGVLALKHDQLVPGVQVSGTVKLSPAPIAQDGDTVIASLTATTSTVARSSFKATWTTAGTGAVAEVQGRVAGRSVAGTLPAP